VIALVALRYRALRPTLAATVPGLLAVVVTVGVLAALDVELNVLSLVALLMVISMGDDFGIFLAEAGEDPAGLEAVHLAVFVSGVTTAFSFALLALSDDPALHAIGLTAAIGVSLCLVFALTVGALVRGGRATPADAGVRGRSGCAG
jgi:predicted exporter